MKTINWRWNRSLKCSRNERRSAFIPERSCTAAAIFTASRSSSRLLSLGKRAAGRPCLSERRAGLQFGLKKSGRPADGIGGYRNVTDRNCAGRQCVGKQCGRTAEKNQEACPSLIGLIEQGHEIIVSHGNGPQVGMINTAFDIACGQSEKIPHMDLMGVRR